MDPVIIIGLAVGLLALIFAGAVTVWAIRQARRGMFSPATRGVATIPKSQLTSLLLQLNNPQHPFLLSASTETDLTIEWSVADAKWLEVLGPASANMIYHASILLDESTRTVKYWEQLQELAAVGGGGIVYREGHTSNGFELWGRRTSRRWGIRSDFSVGEVLNLDFTPADVKDLVRQIANDHGWNFELVLFKRLAEFT